MKKKTELILHIGSHKTGTTALQNSLHANRNLLESKGIYYGNYHELWKMHHNLAFGLFKEALEEELISYPPTHYYFSQIADKSNLVINRIKEDVEISGEYTKVIISSEGLFGPGNFFALHSGIQLNEKQQQKINEYVVAKLYSLLSEFDVKVVCYLRRQDLILESFYNQYCKGPNPDDILPLPTFEQYHSARPVIMDYYHELSNWAELFGKENVIVRPYEKKQLPLGVVHDFYINILGFKEEDYSKLECMDVIEDNSRINRDVLEYKRLLQINGLEGEFVRTSNVLGDTHMNQSFLHQNERGKILDDCRKGNEKVAIEFLSRNDGQLFFDTEIKKTDVYEGLSLEKSIEISKRLINLFIYEKRQVTEYINNLIMQIDNLKTDNNSVVAEGESLRQERDIVLAERESLRQERDTVLAERESLRQERDTVLAERENLRQERDTALAERENLRQERDTALAERESLRQERDTIVSDLNQVYGSKSWRITKPLRFLGRILR